jgi:hypothetical protein
MDKKNISHVINRIGGGTELLYCTRVYVNARLYGGSWLVMEWLLDQLFYLIRGQRQHCRSSYIYERRHHGKAQKAQKP